MVSLDSSFDEHRRQAVLWGLAAALIGFVHAFFSIYWALGGRWLLDTVGGWAEDFANEGGLVAVALLMVVALVKLSIAIVPMALFRRSIKHSARTRVRPLVRIAGVLLAAWGLVSVIGALVGLSGLAGTPSDDNRRTLIAHAAGWDLLFLLWGLCLLVACRQEQRGRGIHSAGPIPQAALEDELRVSSHRRSRKRTGHDPQA